MHRSASHLNNGLRDFLPKQLQRLCSQGKQLRVLACQQGQLAQQSRLKRSHTKLFKRKTFLELIFEQKYTPSPQNSTTKVTLSLLPLQEDIMKHLCYKNLSTLEETFMKMHSNEEILLQIQFYPNMYEPDAVRQLQCCTALHLNAELKNEFSR